ncbi:ATP-binding protein [Ideonella sp. DXS29W]|uniref:histidine kinase n=1 Tax=Ideonella lacteola TaxID=2984193 RepID=A0ABU9BTL7_9BURK
MSEGPQAAGALGGAATPVTPRFTAWADRLLPRSLRGRLMLTMAVGVLLSQGLGTAIWAWQLHDSALRDAREAAQQTARSATGAIRFFRDLPEQYRPIITEQLRTMGGTRFFVQVNRARVPLRSIERSRLADTVAADVRQRLVADLGSGGAIDTGFVLAETQPVTDDGRTLRDLPERWVEGSMLLRPRPAPLLLIQAEFEPGGWLLLATTMPDPYFLDNANPLTRDRLLLQGATLMTVLLLVLWLTRGLTRPLQRLAGAANAFGTAMHPSKVPETGTVELRGTARAFNEMQARIQRFVEDRERLFSSISHDLKTPIMRLKLRTELLDDDAVRADFHEDLDELDVMVKGALQSVKDSDIHENLADIRLDRLIERLTDAARSSGAPIELDVPPITVQARPLALRRALGNLIDNGLRYGGRIDITAATSGPLAIIDIRDHGPGLPAASLEEIFEPYVRLEHGRDAYREGSGLGLGIARRIARQHGGDVVLANRPGGGLVARLSLLRGEDATTVDA